MNRNHFFIGFIVSTLWVCSAQAACNPIPASFNTSSISWQNVDAVETPGSPDAYCSGYYTGILDIQFTTNLTFASGITVSIERKCSATDCIDNEVIIGSTNKADPTNWSTNYTTRVYGSCTDLWGLSTSFTNLNVQISANSSSNATFNISSINITIFYFDSTTGVITTGIVVTTRTLTTGHLTTGRLTTGRLTTGRLTTGPLTTGRITTGRLTTSPMTTRSLTSAAITSPRLTTASAVTTRQLTTAVMTSAVMSTNAITSAAMSTNAMTSAEMTSAELTTAEMTSVDMTSAEMTSAEITSAELTTQALTTAEMTSAEMTTNEFTTASLDITTDLLSRAITTGLTSNQVTSDQVTSGSLTTSPITTGADVTTGVQNGVQTTTDNTPVTSGFSQALVSTGAATTRSPSTSGRSITSGIQIQAGTSSQLIITTSTNNETSSNIISSNESTSNEDFNFSLLYIILGAIIGVLFIAIVVLLGVYVAKRRRGAYNDPESTSSKAVEIPEIETKELPEPDEKDLVVPITKMNQKIEKLKQKIPDLSVNGFDIEFNYIEKKTQHQPATENYTSASLPINASKNRFRNVLPPEGTRVQLTPVTGIDGSDYINANFIKGLIPGSEKAYIATQGPLASTINDFWKMIWEQNTSVILNLTREFENGRLKSERYWPETKDDTFDTPDFEVKLSSVKEAEGLVVRKLTLLQKETKTTREITQFHYIGWPDHGIPSHTDAYIQLAEGADTANTTNAPVVVHCSAGIGRTGTFVTIHSILELVKLHLKENPDKQLDVNIADVIIRLRNQRTGMVQTPEQFEFTYKAIYDGIQFLLHPEMKPPAIPFSEVDTTKLKKMHDSGISNGNSIETNEEGTSEEESESMLKRSPNPTQNEVDISTSVETSER